MNGEYKNELDSLYQRYGYEKRENKGIRIYLFTKSIYNGADIIKLSENDTKIIDELKNQYASIGFAVKVREYESLESAEDTLFRDFFKADGVLSNLKRKYSSFVEKLLENLPDNAEYKYIRSPYEYSEYSLIDCECKTISISPEDTQNSLVNRIVNRINEHIGPLFIIIEAAAGYGKTCTAYEILNEFINVSINKIPFFTELSRDRKATIFKHILQFEIEEQFSNRVDSNVVIHQIKKGKIPLIIDGFDELISKDFTFSSSQFEQVESMLSTIVDLLTDNAKIIITSRKTAIFNSEEFHNWMLDRNVEYTLEKITITEPSIENWLSRDRIDIIKENNFPVEQISNPVLLTFLRYIDIEQLKDMIAKNNSIVENYFNFLLTREQTTQALLIEPETQLRIFRKLVRFLTEWDVKVETKEFIRELLLDYNKKILEETRKKYTPERRPRIDQIADILTNHAFLDRKQKGLIGLVNEFILGTLIADNLVLEKYQEYNDKFYNVISQSFALLALQSYLVQSKNNQLKLWTVFNSYPFPYDSQFFFKVDVELKKETKRNYSEGTLNGFNVSNLIFGINNQFVSTIFSECQFNECEFSLSAFKNCSFVNCRFFDCNITEEHISKPSEHITFFGSMDNNNFIKSIIDFESVIEEDDESLEKVILDLYFKKGSYVPRHRQISSIKQELSDFDIKSVSKIIHKLNTSDIIRINGDLSHLTKQGISYYNELYRTY